MPWLSKALACTYAKPFQVTADCVDGEVRLSEGETQWEGRLEVCFSRRWGTVGSEGWSQVNTRVVCNDLGYELDGGTCMYMYVSISKIYHASSLLPEAINQLNGHPSRKCSVFW